MKGSTRSHPSHDRFKRADRAKPRAHQTQGGSVEVDPEFLEPVQEGVWVVLELL